VTTDLRRAGRAFNVRLDGEPERSPGGLIVHFRFDSLVDAGTAKLEVSVRKGAARPTDPCRAFIARVARNGRLRFGTSQVEGSLSCVCFE
jgi:hypothetical protein